MRFSETADEAWRQRFGTNPPGATETVRQFLVHRSVRSYSDEPVPESLVGSLIGCAQSASTSSNLQLWSVVSVQDADRRARISHLCADQKQVLAAPWLLIFLADHHRLKTSAAAVGEPCLGLDYNEFFTMAVIDASLAAERLVCAAESIGLGICYIGAARNDPAGMRGLLGLPQGTVALFGLCLGWPAPGAEGQVKPRLGAESVWFREQYPSTTSLGDYENRMEAHHVERGMDPSVSWTMRSGRRVDEHHLTGRERLKPFLHEQGFDKR